MTSRSGRGRWARVVEARRQARESLGRDPVSSGPYESPPPKRKAYVSPKPAPAPITQRPSEAVRVLSLGEAAARLGMSRVELKAMIDAGKIEALPTGYTRMIPTREVERFPRAPHDL